MRHASPVAATQKVSFIVRLERKGEKLTITTQDIGTRSLTVHESFKALCEELERSLTDR